MFDLGLYFGCYINNQSWRASFHFLKTRLISSILQPPPKNFQNAGASNNPESKGYNLCEKYLHNSLDQNFQGRLTHGRRATLVNRLKFTVGNGSGLEASALLHFARFSLLNGNCSNDRQKPQSYNPARTAAASGTFHYIPL